MASRYIPLWNGNREESSSATGPGWRLPKRWLSVLLGIFGILATLSLLSRDGDQTPRPQATQQQDSTLPATSTLPYLLGPHEDGTKLWFPPPPQPGTETPFQPAVAPYNLPPAISQRPRTPLFIAFTRNTAMLEQTVLSYIAAGWPREDIIVVDNSGTMDANSLGLLTPKNAFFLDYVLLRRRYGVSILQTPTLLSFAQLMNFYLRVSMAHGWRYFFWSHMDVAVLSDEDAKPYKSFYARVLEILGTDLHVSALHDDIPGNGDEWALKYFTYDWLTLVNVAAWRKIGAWDPFVPYYATDCDAYSRVALNGLTKDDVRAGRIFDLPDAIQDVEHKFFPPADGAEQPGSQRYRALVAELEALERQKPETHRNSWQGVSDGGKGEPWTYDPRGFQKMWWAMAEKGRDMYRLKWGTQECRLDEHGVELRDAWKEDSNE
ncbi:hypothetical protein A1O7_07565 [Cladophialophora yegresii CBS 114405]|uniref:Uncharacterized protein n=1 Tax=Cladophialophora yegresii CBS 114405 TaxID=1182544 RepID=W9VNU6_9EURO|nr:uncharacterized protein A1O7_07565 [Cladophialophora yegresii CBS 114405]EXJ57218.1 hypothetical protein A1O7_07565 [Cladophialophora yegresii CBS 114405]